MALICCDKFTKTVKSGDVYDGSLGWQSDNDRFYGNKELSMAVNTHHAGGNGVLWVRCPFCGNKLGEK